MDDPVQKLKPTSWLAKRLNISITTIERLRALNSTDIPTHIVIGKSIRYDENAVEQWLQDRSKSLFIIKTPGKHANDKI
jgi:predicted DNA-binding transcriptional regulator AlpA